jgi:hypothetical protein
MKDAKGHGSNPRGSSAHQVGVVAVGRAPAMWPIGSLHPTQDVFHANPSVGPVRPLGNQALIDKYRGELKAGRNTEPLMITDKGDILDGHHRFAAYRAENRSRVPVEVIKGATFTR